MRTIENKKIPAWAIHSTSEELIKNIKRRHRRQQIRRRRIGLALAVCMITILLISTVVFAQGTAGKIEYEPIAVEPGDTLWDLASKYYPNMDKRKAIADIKEVNHLTDSTLYPGDVLMVPGLN